MAFLGVSKAAKEKVRSSIVVNRLQCQVDCCGLTLLFVLTGDDTLTLQKSRMPQIQGGKGEAVVGYAELLPT
ncbi:MAG: hypothetical protein JW883_04450, partial [Deltaproteobacteria bacterium]|nr:hypothetical protein [Deltaproteobacteria bacterium]